MELSTAIRLIKKGVSNSETVQTWADFGAGTGLFTRALASCLNQESTIYAIDRDAAALSKLEAVLFPTVKKINKDFINENIDIEPLDGIVLANALHFVNDKLNFIQQLKNKLKTQGKIIIIEYDMSAANPWVPYPINFSELQKLAGEAELAVLKLDEELSVFNERMMYSAVCN
jgi:trans-aconitate methyltransferase